MYRYYVKLYHIIWQNGYKIIKLYCVLMANKLNSQIIFGIILYICIIKIGIL